MIAGRPHFQTGRNEFYHLLFHAKKKEQIHLIIFLNNFGGQDEAGDLKGSDYWPSGNIGFCRSILNSAVRY